MNFKVNDRRRFNNDGTVRGDDEVQVISPMPTGGTPSQDAQSPKRIYVAQMGGSDGGEMRVLPRDPLAALTAAVNHLIASEEDLASWPAGERLIDAFADFQKWQGQEHRCWTDDDPNKNVLVHEDGAMGVYADDGGLTVNFCPWCGYRAKTSIEQKYARKTK